MDNLRLSESDPHGSGPDKSRVDQMLHQRLSEIFRERCRSDSSLIKEFLRAPERTEQNSIIDLILEHDPVLGKKIWKKLLRKLSLLWIAVLESYHNSAELLVHSGADVNELYGLQTHYAISGLNKKSTLLYALLEMDPSEENERLIRLVTDHGADLEARDSEGRTALHLAVTKDRIELIEMLLNKGADFQARDSKVQTALHLVVTKGRIELFEMLLKKGADFQAQDFLGRTALFLAVEQGRVQMTQMILEKAAADNNDVLSIVDNLGRIPLFVAVRSCKAIELLSLLIKYGADLKARNSDGETILHLAAMGGQVHVAEMLLEKGADLQARGFNGQTVLYYAVKSGRAEMFGMLLEKGADLRARDFDSQTVLHCTVRHSQVQMTQMFLKKTALENVNVVNDADNKGNTPVLFAADKCKADELVPLLIKHGADVSVKDADGENLLYRLSCIPVEHVDLARDLIERGASLDDRKYSTQYQPIHKAIEKNHIQLVKLYLDSGADVNSLVNDNETPLHIAAKPCGWNSAPMMKILLERGADIDRRTISEGRTPLHLVCVVACTVLAYVKPVERLRLLLFAGADVLIEDHNGNTALSLLVDRLCVDEPRIRLLLKALALRKVCQSGIELKDDRIIERHLKLRDYYRSCIEQIERMKSTRFIETCTFLDILEKRHCQIAALMCNPNFVINFKNYNLSEFSMYAEELHWAFESANKHYQFMLDHEDVINEAVYYILPYMVVRRIVHHMCDCCKNEKNE